MSDDLAELLHRAVPDQGLPLLAHEVLVLARRRAKVRRAIQVSVAVLIAAGGVSAGAFGLAGAGHQARTSVPAVGGSSTSPSAESPASGVGAASPPSNTLSWAYSGLRVPLEGSDTIDTRAYSAWAKASGRLPGEVGAAGALWVGKLPDSQTVAVVQAWPFSGGPTHTITYAVGPTSGGRIVSDLVLDPALAQFTVTVPGPRSRWQITLRPSGAQVTQAP
jgi:hypothetical protein